MISVQNVTKTYGDVVAVNAISFAIREGEITGLLGPNGAGKTTTLRMLTSYLKPDSGSIVVGDIDAERDPGAVRRAVGYLPESAPIYADMSVYDFLRFVAEVHGIGGDERIAEMGRTCGITEVMHKTIGELSKGYKQRTGLAAAMIHDPQILILDEPTSGLDPNQIIEIRTLIRELGRSKTVILSTHILPEVEATCDRVIIIDRGAIVADDRPGNLQKAMGAERIVTVRAAGVDGGTLARELAVLPGVTRAEALADDSLAAATVHAGAADDVRPRIFTLARDRGWILYELAAEQVSLERVFRELTIGGRNE